MLLALLYQQDGRIAATAPACDQQPFGDRFWREMYPEQIDLHNCETAYVEINNAELVDWLLNMYFRDGADAARVVDAYLGIANR